MSAKPQIQQLYEDEVLPAMVSEFDYASVMQVPKITKVIINIGLGEALQDAGRSITLLAISQSFQGRSR